MKKEWYRSSVFIVLMCFLCFPVGLVLLGSNNQVKWLSKILLSLTYVVIILVFFIYYQPVLRSKTTSNHSASTENIIYKINRIYKKEALINGLSETIKPSNDEIFLCVDLDVTNSGDSTVFFISLVDDPKIEASTNTYYPDLTLSQDPFGDVGPRKTLSGFLVFRIPVNEKPIVFKISNLSKSINF